MRSILTGKFTIKGNILVNISEEGIGEIHFQEEENKISFQIVIGLSGRIALIILSSRETFDFSTKSTANKLIWNSRKATGKVMSLIMNRIE